MDSINSLLFSCSWIFSTRVFNKILDLGVPLNVDQFFFWLSSFSSEMKQLSIQVYPLFHSRWEILKISVVFELYPLQKMYFPFFFASCFGKCNVGLFLWEFFSKPFCSRSPSQKCVKLKNHNTNSERSKGKIGGDSPTDKSPSGRWTLVGLHRWPMA